MSYNVFFYDILIFNDNVNNHRISNKGLFIVVYICIYG